MIERLVGMQAQWPSAPYVGIWIRTTSFRREALERELASSAVVKATVIRQTPHLESRLRLMIREARAGPRPARMRA